jgi:hypothetical protein
MLPNGCKVFEIVRQSSGRALTVRNICCNIWSSTIQDCVFSSVGIEYVEDKLLSIDESK